MTSKEQEKLFADLRAAHPGWSGQFCSGYVHGVVDEARRDTPAIAYRAPGDQYSIGYMIAFAVRRGSDCEVEPWFNWAGGLNA